MTLTQVQKLAKFGVRASFNLRNAQSEIVKI